MAQLLSIQIGRPQDLAPTPDDLSHKPWRTAFYKQPIEGPIAVGKLGLEGDDVADRRVHGGVDKAICVYSAEHFPYWRYELGFGSEFTGGAFGENFTLAELTEGDVCIGDVWRIGSATLQVSQPRQPCWKLARRWKVKDLTLRVIQNGYTGWYLRVLTEGEVEPGAEIALDDRPHADWPLTRANQVMYDKASADKESLARVPALSTSWHEQLLGG